MFLTFQQRRGHMGTLIKVNWVLQVFQSQTFIFFPDWRLREESPLNHCSDTGTVPPGGSACSEGGASCFTLRRKHFRLVTHMGKILGLNIDFPSRWFVVKVLSFHIHWNWNWRQRSVWKEAGLHAFIQEMLKKSKSLWCKYWTLDPCQV